MRPTPMKLEGWSVKVVLNRKATEVVELPATMTYREVYRYARERYGPKVAFYVRAPNH